MTQSASSSSWVEFEAQQSMQRVIESVVSIQFSCPVPFDLDSDAFVSEATGFVVDVNGLILTNRHVASPGPFRGYAVFSNHEECPVYPVYRDPVHDFGILRFDPLQIKRMPIRALKLRETQPTVGERIYIIGNDNGDKLCILPGHLSRLDRNAPDYGLMTYNDFNTNYFQASASSSGGSSGSPVVDANGQVLALQAGGSTQASTDFFLPLDRAKRAIDCIKSGKPIARGTLQTQWLLRPFDACTRLGLSAATETKARNDHPDSIGLLVAERVLPEGPADGLIQEGDCLIEVNGTPLCRFDLFDEILDNNVGNEISVTLERGGERIVQSIEVMDLHSITPDRYLEACGSIFHDVSYQIARHYASPVRGVYIAGAGNYFAPSSDKQGWVLDELDNKSIMNLKDLTQVLSAIPDGQFVSARFHHVTDPFSSISKVVHIKHFKDMTLAVRNDSTGLWDFSVVAPKPQPIQLGVQHTLFPHVHVEGATEVGKLSQSIVMVDATCPVQIESYPCSSMSEAGLIIDSTKGLVLVSRFCIPHFLVDVTVTFAETVILPAKILFLHPQHNYAIIQYDPELIDAPILTPQLSQKACCPGESLHFVGYNSNTRIISTSVTVVRKYPINVPISVDIAPRYRATNTDHVRLDSQSLVECLGGVFADADGRVRALWLTFMGNTDQNSGLDRIHRMAVDAADLGPVCDMLQKDPRSLGIIAKQISPSTARICGVPKKYIEEKQCNETEPRFFAVEKVSTSVAHLLEDGDIILTVNGNSLASVNQLVNLHDDVVEVLVSRGNKLLNIEVPTTPASALTTTSVVSWCGLLVHEPHQAVLQQVKEPPSKVYISNVDHGSPAQLYDIPATHFITHVNGQPTRTLDTFYSFIRNIPSDTYLRLRTVTLEGVPQASTIRTDYHYFSTWRRDLVNGKWVLRDKAP